MDYGPNAVEIEPGARISKFVCGDLDCKVDKLYLIQGKSGALPPRCNGDKKRRHNELPMIEITFAWHGAIRRLVEL